jgi:hypothetical protein
MEKRFLEMNKESNAVNFGGQSYTPTMQTKMSGANNKIQCTISVQYHLFIYNTYHNLDFLFVEGAFVYTI